MDDMLSIRWFELGAAAAAVVAGMFDCAAFSLAPEMPLRRIANFLCRSAIRSPEGDEAAAAAGFYKVKRISTLMKREK